MNTDPIVVQEDLVIFRGELGGEVIHDVVWSGSDHFEEYTALFENVGQFPGDPSESYYQGMTFTRVIRRRSDGRLFGFSFWEDISKHGEAFSEPNGEEHGLEPEYDENYEPIGGEVWIFLPVEEFSIRGYRTVSP